MKFTLTTTAYFYDDAEAEKLKTLGFRFEELRRSERDIFPPCTWHIDRDYNPEIEINSLEELIAFQKKCGKIIINGNDIEIYDYSE